MDSVEDVGAMQPSDEADPTLDRIEALRTLRSAFVADALDALGLAGQSVGPDIRMLSGRGPVVGRAITGRTRAIVRSASADVERDPVDPYGGLKAVLRRLRQDDLFVLATARCDDYAAWGELVSMAAQRAGAVGLLTDGLVRDVEPLIDLGFPVFARGTSPVDIAGRAQIVDIGRPVVIDGVTVETGDLVIGDRDGTVVVPQAVAADVVSRAGAKARDEEGFRRAVAQGTSLWEAFELFGVL
jgi:regulator of RNase E activity RraA